MSEDESETSKGIPSLSKHMYERHIMSFSFVCCDKIEPMSIPAFPKSPLQQAPQGSSGPLPHDPAVKVSVAKQAAYSPHR